MHILILNGSPRSEKSNTMHLTRAFVDGVKKDGDRIDTIDIACSDIHGCMGCMSCWSNGGTCVIKDDVPRLQEEFFFKADLVIWSFPLYYFEMPSQLKAFMDRLFANCWPDMVTYNDGYPTHPLHHDTSNMRHIIISTCGFFTSRGLYDAVLAHFRILYRTTFAGAITCGQGALFSNNSAARVTEPYLEKVKEAGREFATKGKLSEETQAKLARQLIPQEMYMDKANSVASWKYKLDHSKK